MSNVANKPPYVKDACLSFVGGVNAAVPPHTIGRDQCVAAVNSTMRGGRAKPRHGYYHYRPSVPSGAEMDPPGKRLLYFEGTNTEDNFQDGRFQHAGFFEGNGNPCLVSSHGGRLFKVNLKNFKVSDITPTKSTSTTTTAQLIIPAVGATASLSVASTTGMDEDLAAISVGGYPLSIVSVDSAVAVTVENNIAGNAAVVVAPASTVTFRKYDPNSSTKDLGWSAQAGDYFVYQDNQSLPIIFDGASSRRSVPSQREVPVGNVMAYAHGRLIVARPDRVSYRIGDLIFGSSGTASKGYKDAVLKFTENDYLNEGGEMQARVFGANSVFGEIKSITPIAMGDTSLGQGPVMIGQAKMVFTLQLPFDRDTWKNMANPLQTATPLNGPLGQRSTILVNEDMWYRAVDGIRSYIMAARERKSWGNTAMSAEIGDMLTYDSQFLLEYGSACYFDNRIMMTISPVKSDYGIWHRGLAVMDFNPISTIRTKTSPAWDGIWTGQRVLQIIACTVENEERCFAYVLNDANKIEFWEITKGLKEDNEDTPIVWETELRAMDCGNVEQFKNLQTARLTFRNVTGTVTYAVKYRSDQAPCYQAWDNGTFCALNEDCAAAACTGPITYKDQQRSNIKLRQPADDFDEITGWKYRTGYMFQPKVEMTGYCELESMIVYAVDCPESLSRDRIV